MSRPATRRAALRVGAAAIGALCAPAAALAVVAPAVDLDAELFRLIASWAPALAAAEREDERHGEPFTVDALRSIFAEVNAIEVAIEAHAPRTIPGLAAKARWLLHRYPDNDVTPAELFLTQIAALGEVSA